MNEKLPYVAPEARLICFSPREAISTEDDGMSYDDTMALFGVDSQDGDIILSGEVTEPED